MKTSKATTLALVVLTMAGCGGSGGGKSFGTGGGGAVASGMTLTAGTGYNGSATALAGTISSLALDSTRIVSFGTGSRSINFSFPKRSFAVGDTFTPGSGGVFVDYRETVARDGDERKWTGTGGTVKVTAATATRVDVSFDGIGFAADTTDGADAAGTFTAQGNVKGFPNEAATTIGSADIQISSVTGSNIDTTPYPSNATITVSTVDGEDYYSVSRQANGFPASQISFKIPKDAAVGRALPISTSATGARAYFFQLSPSVNLQGISGTVTIVSKTATGVHLTFEGILFDDTLSSSSTDGFVLKGSITK